MSLRATQIFIPGGLPVHTYVQRKNEENGERLETSVRSAGDHLCKVLTVVGTTKCGKTVLVDRVFPRDRATWIDGGAVQQASDLWSFMLEALDGHNQTSVSETTAVQTDLGATISGKASAVLIEGKGEIEAGVGRSTQSSRAQARSSTPMAAALKALGQQATPLIVDDFHYLPKKVQAGLVRALKPLVFRGLPVIFIAVPHRRFDVVKIEKEMTGRLEVVRVPAWSEAELIQIAESGFGLLNVSAQEEASQFLASQAFGSPHLM